MKVIKITIITVFIFSLALRLGRAIKFDKQEDTIDGTDNVGQNVKEKLFLFMNVEKNI